jgi:hypothetical protein
VQRRGMFQLLAGAAIGGFWTLIIPYLLIPPGTMDALAQNPVYDASANRQSAEVKILAISSSIEAGAGGSQEIYLADVRFGASTHQMAKLVDAHPRHYSPILRSVLVSRHLLRMTLVRDPNCDSTGKDFFLAPGDSNIFDPSTRSILNDQASEVIPCFLVIHEDTRLAK